MKERKIALIKGLRDPQIQGYATCAADIKKHIEACENKKLIQYHRDGKTWAKPKMGGIILNRPIDSAEMVRKDCNFHPTQVGDHFMFDWDCNVTPFTPQPEDLAKRFVETLEEQVPGFAECVVFEKSCSGALHGAVPCFSGNPKQDLAFYEKVMGVDADRSVLNPSRAYILSHHILVGSYDCLFREVSSSVIEGLRKLSQGEEAIAEPQTQVVVEKESPTVATDLEVYREIVSELLGGGQLPAVGTRSNTLYRHVIEISSLGLTSFEQLAELFGKGFDWYGLAASEGKSVVKSALRKDSPERSTECRNAVSAVLEKRPHTTVQLSAETSVVVPVSEEACHIVSPSESETETATSRAEWTPWGAEPKMPEKLPTFIRHLVAPIRPRHCWPHVITLAEPALATYLKSVTFSDMSGLSKPLFNGWFAVSCAPSSSGKSTATTAIKAITKKLDEMDREIRAKLQDWLAEDRTRKSTDGVRKPLNNSRLSGSDTTSSGLFQRFKELDPGTALYISTPELMSLKNVASGDYVKFFLMAHDAEEYSVERSTSTGESGRATLSLNFSAMAPISIGQEFFGGHTEDGLVGRSVFATIVEDPNWDDMERLYDAGKLKSYSDGFEKYIQRLEAAEGKHFDKAEIVEFCEGLQRQAFQIAADYSSASFRTLTRRAIIHLQKMCYLYLILEGKWTDNLRAFLEWRWQYMGWSMYRVLGSQIEREMTKSAALLSSCKAQSGPVSILSSMPERFTLADLMARRKSLSFADLSESAAKAQLRTLKHRGLVQQDGTDYINLKKKP